jgi:hypothetical protein
MQMSIKHFDWPLVSLMALWKMCDVLFQEMLEGDGSTLTFFYSTGVAIDIKETRKGFNHGKDCRLIGHPQVCHDGFVSIRSSAYIASPVHPGIC